jgi:hypothetical protein
VTRSEEDREKVASPLLVEFEALFRRCAQVTARWRSAEWYNARLTLATLPPRRTSRIWRKYSRCGLSRKMLKAWGIDEIKPRIKW